MIFIGLSKSGILGPKLHNHNLLLESRNFNVFFSQSLFSLSASHLSHHFHVQSSNWQLVIRIKNYHFVF